MKLINLVESYRDPCAPIQADLSAMLDGELDAATVRRVMVHSDLCNSCGAFLKGVRNQVRAHKMLSGVDLVGTALGTQAQENVLDSAAFRGFTFGKDSARSEKLWHRLLENQRQLARILYELGRGFVLMGVSPNFSRVVAQEPVPVPDMCLRGRNLLDEVERLGSDDGMNAGSEWVRAKTLFENREPKSAEENLAKGKRLLREALMLSLEFHEARIYLGQAYQVEGDFNRARNAYSRVLAESEDRIIRAYALENLGNVYLEDDRPKQAIPFFQQLLDSGVIAQEPRFHTTYFNLALAHGLCGEFDALTQHLTSLYEGFPHRRRVIGMEIKSRESLLETLRQQPELLAGLVERFPCWFQFIAQEGC